MSEPTGVRLPASPWRSSVPVLRDWAPPLSARPTPPPQPPAPAGSPGTRRRRWPWLAVPVTLVVLVVVVIGLGGFRQRRDVLHTVPIGATISTGAFDYTFTRATVQQQKDLDTPIYKVMVYGTAQNTTDTGRGPSTDQFVGRDKTDKDVEEPEVTKIGTSTDFTVGTVLNPGLPPVPFRVDFEFKQTWRPTGTFRIAAASMTEEKTFLNEQQPNWQNDASTIYQVYVPMQTLAPADN